MKVGETLYIAEQREIGEIKETFTFRNAIKQFYGNYGAGWCEKAIAIITKRDGTPISIMKLSEGSRSGAFMSPNFTLGSVIQWIENSQYDFSDVSVYFAHNHPSGNTTVSRADRKVSRTLKDACRACEIDFGGSYIYAEGSVVSCL